MHYATVFGSTRNIFGSVIFVKPFLKGSREVLYRTYKKVQGHFCHCHKSITWDHPESREGFIFQVDIGLKLEPFFKCSLNITSYVTSYSVYTEVYKKEYYHYKHF